MNWDWGHCSSNFDRDRLVTVSASEMAQRHTGRSVPNAVLLGGFAALTAEVSIGAVAQAVKDRFGAEGSVAENNVAAAAEAYAYIRREMSGHEGGLMLNAPTD